MGRCFDGNSWGKFLGWVTGDDCEMVRVLKIRDRMDEGRSIRKNKVLLSIFISRDSLKMFDTIESFIIEILK